MKLNLRLEPLEFLNKILKGEVNISIIEFNIFINYPPIFPRIN